MQPPRALNKAQSKNKKSGKGKTEFPVAYEIEAFADVSEDGKVYLVKWKGGYMCITPRTQRNPPGPPFTPRTQPSKIHLPPCPAPLPLRHSPAPAPS